MTVHRDVAKFDATYDVERSHSSSRKDRKRRKGFVAGSKTSIAVDPRESRMKLAKKRNVNHKTICRVVNEDLDKK